LFREPVAFVWISASLSRWTPRSMNPPGFLALPSCARLDRDPCPVDVRVVLRTAVSASPRCWARCRSPGVGRPGRISFTSSPRRSGISTLSYPPDYGGRRLAMGLALLHRPVRLLTFYRRVGSRAQLRHINVKAFSRWPGSWTLGRLACCCLRPFCKFFTVPPSCCRSGHCFSLAAALAP